MNTIDWNKMSELGLLERINREILHPLGLAASRDVETGFSTRILVADDRVWNYCSKMEVGPILTKEEIFDNLERSAITDSVKMDEAKHKKVISPSRLVYQH